MQGSVANPSPQQEQEYSEADMVDQLKTTDVEGVDPGLMSKNMDLPSSLAMEQDEVDVSYPLATAEPKDCLTQENRNDGVEVWHLATISMLMQLLSLHFHSYNHFCWDPLQMH